MLSGHIGRVLVPLLLIGYGAVAVASPQPKKLTAHQHGFVSIDDSPLPLDTFAGKVLLVVNTASFCGFTSQYQGLQALWTAFKKKGLVVIGVPSNDFGWQEPGTNDEIKQFCQGAFGVTFPLTAKYKVKGANAHPFYQWARETYGDRHAPRWNFHKYLVGRDGRIVGAYASGISPKSERLLTAVKSALAKPQ